MVTFVLYSWQCEAATGAAAPDWPSRGSAAPKTRGFEAQVRVDLTIPHPDASCTLSFLCHETWNDSRTKDPEVGELIDQVLIDS